MAKKPSVARVAPLAAAVAAELPSTIQPDTAQADVRGVAERSLVWAALESANGTVRSLMLDGLKATAKHGATSAAELAEHWPTCNNPGVYAPNFNRGNKAAVVIGVKAACDLVDKAAKIPGAGSAFDKAKDALQSVMKAGKAREKAGKSGLATGAEAKAIVDTAVSDAARLLAERAAKKADKKTAGPVLPVADTLALAFAEFDAIMARFAKLHAPEGKEKTLATAMQDLRRARENIALCVK